MVKTDVKVIKIVLKVYSEISLCKNTHRIASSQLICRVVSVSHKCLMKSFLKQTLKQLKFFETV